MSETRVQADRLLGSLPDEWPENLLPCIQAQVRRSRSKVVVLDDDPTGTQTVHSVPVLTEWPVEALRAELRSDRPSFYLLTNSRSLPPADAQQLNKEIGQNLSRAASLSDTRFVVVSRSDSTLRGHFPGEMESLSQGLDIEFDAWLLVPFFQEGGRFTVGNVHYVAEGEWLTPAGDTAYARDATFGYAASDLRAWVEEKTMGQIPASRVLSISIAEIRSGGPVHVAKRLMALPHGSICVVNAASSRDLEVFVSGLLTAEGRGRRFLYRTAASFVRVRAGIPPRPLLTRPELELPHKGGALFVVGSHVPKSTEQVMDLLRHPSVVGVEMNVKALVDDRQPTEIERIVGIVNQGMERGDTVVMYTSRIVVTGDDADSSLLISKRVSESVVTTVRRVTQPPRFMLAKGGITSSDIATDGLGVKRAVVRGQILPGVPVWQLGSESRFPGLIYIVFPGNVGAPDALTQVVALLEPNAR